MKRTAIAVALLGSSMAMSLNATASNGYFEFGYMQYMESADGLDGKKVDINVPALIATAGFKVTENISIEGFLGNGIAKDEFKMSGADVDVELGNIIGANIKGSLGLTENLNAIGKVGFVSRKAEVTASLGSLSSSDTDTDSGVTFTGGLEYSFTKSVYGTAAYTRYNEDAGTVTFGVGYNF